MISLGKRKGSIFIYHDWIVPISDLSSVAAHKAHRLFPSAKKLLPMCNVCNQSGLKERGPQPCWTHMVRGAMPLFLSLALESIDLVSSLLHRKDEETTSAPLSSNRRWSCTQCARVGVIPSVYIINLALIFWPPARGERRRRFFEVMQPAERDTFRTRARIIS